MLNQIKRLSAIVNKLSGICEYVGKEDLLEAMSGDMAENGPYTLRTLQRDIKTIEAERTRMALGAAASSLTR